MSQAALADHSMDGTHQVTYYSVDEAGNVETPKSLVVNIDTCCPVTQAPKAAAVMRDRVAKVSCKIVDAQPCATYAWAQVVVKKASGRVVLTRSYAKVRTNLLVTLKLRCRLPKGTYRFVILARDAAGNVQSKAGHNTLTVR